MVALCLLQNAAGNVGLDRGAHREPLVVPVCDGLFGFEIQCVQTYPDLVPLFGLEDVAHDVGCDRAPALSGWATFRR